MKKIIVLLLIIIALTGCETPKDYETEQIEDNGFIVFVDDITCVEYISSVYKYEGGISVRYNQDGTIRTNKKCLEEK